MGLTQLDLENRTKVQAAIAVINEHEPPEGYQVCLSAGGKDSQVAEHQCRSAGVSYDLVYCLTGIDPPEAVKFMKEHYPSVIIQKPKMSIFRGIEIKGLPRRNSRWCCEILKEYSGVGRVLITGIRREESVKRRARKQVEIGHRGKCKFVHPIFGWSESEVWEYIDTLALSPFF